MPTIQKRGDTYRIRVSAGYDSTGKQLMKSMTWQPAPGMTQKQIEKELDRQAVLFENKVKSGQYMEGNIRFSEYAEMWMQNAQLAPATRSQYEDLLRRINAAIGHIRLDRLQPHHLEAFYKNLREKGIKERGSYAVSSRLANVLKEKKISRIKAGELSGVSAATVGVAAAGKHISIDSARKIAAALNKKPEELFTLYTETTGLSDKSVLHHHRLISSILSKAKRDRLVPYNVAVEYTDAPKVRKKEPPHLDDAQAREMVVQLLNEEDIRIKTALMLLLYSGLRRGELCGLSWPDIEEKSRLIHVMRASQYQEGAGIVEVPTKNEDSVRAVKLPPFMFELLNMYKKWWTMQRLANGDRWKGEKQRLFIREDGSPINPDTINLWLDRFLAKHDFPRITPHGLRHTFATLQIAAGVDLKTLQARGGWAQPDTPMKIYAHAIKSAAEAATEALDNMLTPATYQKA
ncbi:MAG: site-specific integrase [Clostridiales bacterium]|nr:site-specific integrase [Clostridiales bacterium]